MLKAWISVGVCTYLKAKVISDLTQGLQASRGKQIEVFHTLFLRSVSCTFLAFSFANYFSFKCAHPNSHLSSFHKSTFPAPPLKNRHHPSLVLWKHERATLRTRSSAYSPPCSHIDFKSKAMIMQKRKACGRKDTDYEV